MIFIHLSKADKDDLPEILALQKLAFYENSVRYNDVNIQPLTQTLSDITEEAKTHIFLKATVDGKIVGSVRGILRDDHAYIGKLIVHPDYQNRGIGRKLMLAVESEFDTTKFELGTGHLDTKNIAFYTKLGYEIYAKEKVSESLFFIRMRKVRNGNCA